MKQKYTGYRYVSIISPSETEWYHIVNIDVYLYKDNSCLKKEQHQLNHKFHSYMPSSQEIEALKPIVKTYIHEQLTKKYKGIILLPPKEHKYIWDTKVNKE